MKKKILLAVMVIAIIIIAFGAISVSAATYGNLTYSVSNSEATITDCKTSASGELIIPATLGGYPVTSIGYGAFENCTSLTSITLPDSVTSIVNYAFENCTSLTSITIPDGVTSIDRCAFYNCSSLTSITIPDGVTSIGDYTFYNCSSLTSITIPDSVTSIADRAFKNCSSLTSITIPVGVTSIADDAFYNCSNLTSITIPDSVISIGAYAFYGTAYYSNTLNWENNVLYIGNHLIKAQTSISGEYNIKSKTITIADSAFYNCSSLVSITIPVGVTSIADDAFYNCSKLTSITILDGVTNIGFQAFYNCSKLTSITIPDSVTSIGDDAFYGTAYYSNTLNWENNVLYIGNHLIKAQTSISGEYNIKSRTITIADRAFYNCSKLTSITIPDSVTSIGSYAFYNCSKLTSITIPDSVTSIGYGAFYNCINLTSITIPNGVTSIGYGAFYNCINLTSITIPDSVTSIGVSAFEMCSRLTDVYYNGTEDDWNKIYIGSSNERLNDAEKKFFWYVTIIDENDKQLSKKMQDFNTLVDTSAIVIPDGCGMVLYTDKEQIEVYDTNSPINKNLTLYVGFIKLNILEFEDATTVDIGEKGITQSVSCVTDKTAKYFSCTLKVNDRLEVQEIKSDIFEIEQNSEVIGNNTYYYLFLIYNCDENIPTYKKLNAFEIEFDVSENAISGEILTIEILDDAILADDDGNSYEFVSIDKAEIKITPILAEKITIIGADEIDIPTQYMVSVLPENTTNSNVEWSVSDETIVTISEDGIVTPVKNGTVTIRATAQDESCIYAEKTVSVNVLGTVNSITTNIGIWDKEYSSNTTNYTIYVPENTTSIKLTAMHDGTFKTDKTTFVNNVARTVPLSTTSNETVLDLTYTCDGYDGNTYTITIIKFEGTKTEVSDDKKLFTITPINVENGKTVILALYDGEKFVKMQSAVYTGEAIPFTTTRTYTNAKVFVWNDLKTLSPVCEVEIVK